MRIRYVEGNIFAGPERVLVHGCNARGAMGAGIARQVRRLYPAAYKAYREAFEALPDRSQGLPLGSTTWALGGDGRRIVNAVTQRDYGRDEDRVYVDYEAVRAIIRAIDARAAAEDGLSQGDAVAFPLIGAGLAGGSWSRIAGIIEAEANAFQPVVYLFDGKVPDS